MTAKIPLHKRSVMRASESAPLAQPAAQALALVMTNVRVVFCTSEGENIAIGAIRHI